MTLIPEPNDPAHLADAPSFAEVLVSRLRASCTPKAAPYPIQAKLPDSSVDTDMEDDLLPEMEPAEAAAPATLPTRRLLTILRLAATFVSEEALEPLRLRAAVTILRGIDARDLTLVTEGLKVALPDQGWRVLAPSVSEDAVSKTSAERFLREIDRLLDTTAPVLILLPFDIALPAHLQQPGVASFTYAPISADILLGFLAAMDRAPEDAGAFRSALPEPTILARLDTAQAAAALRFGSGLDLAQRLEALTGPTLEGPRLEEGFSDSPVVQAARRVVGDLGAWRRGEIGWSDFSHSILLYGPPGTGKTWLARAMGNSAGIACVTGSFAEWQAAGHLGDMLREMRRTFAIALREAPAILFIDEIDAMGSRTGDDRHNLNYRTQVINAFLGEMNAIAIEPGVVVVGACNHVDRIDPAVTRAGRFDLKFEVPMPDATAILAVLRQHLKVDFPADALELLARQAVGHSLASIDAAIRAARSEARHTRQPLDLAMLRDQLHLTSADESREVLWRYAVHEAGHTVVAAALRLGTIKRMSISRDGGQVASQLVIGHGVLTEIENEICHDLAGRAAEALIFGEVSAGAGGSLASDLSQATRRALMIETNWGLGDLGPIWMPAPETVLLTDEQLRNRVRSRMEAAEERALAILTTHRANLLGLAETLLQKRSMRADEILPWVHAVQAHAAQADEVNPDHDKGPLET
jgi:MoxR-like ATPase